MMTPNDGGTHGRTPPDRFPARPEIVAFCNRLRKNSDPHLLGELPATTSAPYKVHLFGTDENFVNKRRNAYFAGLDLSFGIVFLDPDNGFEPDKSCTEKHVAYAEIEALLGRLPFGGVISVFQHFRRRPFDEDFARIRERLRSGFPTALFWHALMFVTVAPTREVWTRVLEANRLYAKSRPVKVLP